MMKIICALLLSLAILSCRKEEAPADTCLSGQQTAYYLHFWKREFLKRNAMSAGYFDAHISGVKASSHCWNSGVSFIVDYRVTIDWAVISDRSEFIVKLNAAESAYQHLSIPRDTLLDSAQLQVVLDNEVWASSAGVVKPLASLKYATYDAAVKAFRDSSGSGAISPDRLSYYVPGNVPRKNGYPYIIGSGTINNGLNQCIAGHINLHSGEWRADTIACVSQ